MKVKIKLLFKIVISIILVFMVINMIFNAALDQHIEKKAKNLVNSYTENLRKILESNTDQYLYGNDYSSYFDISIDIPIEIEAVVVCENYVEKTGSIYIQDLMLRTGMMEKFNAVTCTTTRREKMDIIRYCENNEEMKNEDTCRKVEIQGKVYYVTQVKTTYNSSLSIIDSYEFSYSMSDYYGIDSKVEIAIIIANTSNLDDFTRRISTIFAAVSIVTGVIICIAGLYIGLHNENDKTRLKYFFQNASHDLKTPIMNMQGYAEGISTNVIKDHTRAAEVILNESERMGNLVEEILYLSRLDCGQVNINNEKVDISELIYFCLGRIELEATQKSIDIQVIMGKIPEIKGDEVWLEKAISNILSNALRYARTKITLTCTAEKKYIKIVIGDDGAGINEKDISHIFERFYKGKEGNTGIGLAIAKEAVKLHRGSITVRNNNGAEFQIKLRRIQ